MLSYRERINKLLLVFADELREVTEMTHGNIAAIVGLKNVCGVSSQLNSSFCGRHTQEMC